MTRKDREKLNQCWQSGCQYFETHCLIHHGNQCKRLDGYKIPRMRHFGLDKPEGQTIRNRLPVTTFKPYFVESNGTEAETDDYTSRPSHF